MHYGSAKTNYGKPNLKIMTWNRLKPSNQKPPELCVLLSCMVLHETCTHFYFYISVGFHGPNSDFFFPCFLVKIGSLKCISFKVLAAYL